MSTKEPLEEDVAGAPNPGAPDLSAVSPDGQAPDAADPAPDTAVPDTAAPDGQAAAEPPPRLTAAEFRLVALMRRTMPEELLPMLLAPAWYQGMAEAELQGGCMVWYALVAVRYVVFTVVACYRL